MRICSACGEVFPDGSLVCRTHGETLRAWTEVTDTQTYTGVDTDVENRRVEDERRFEFGGAAGEIQSGPLGYPRVEHSGDTPPVMILDDSTARRRAPQAGRVLGERYLLGERIGVGGYGAVFDATDLQSGEQVAVKMLSPAASQSAELVTRFHREAIAATRVRHPNIVEVSDFDVDEDGTHFIVMEYLDGVDLAEVLEREGRLPPARALAIAAQCASGLAAAHDAGILHRDLKPANVFLVQRDGRPDFVKIIDFGISKLTRAAGHYSDVTSASKVVGSPCYMSPEQARGEDLDGRCDVYGLGIILYEMLSGERPFVGTSAIETLTKHVDAPRIPPSQLRRSLASIAGLDDLVVGAIAPRREHRPRTMAAFQVAIIDCLGGVDPRAASVSGPRYRVSGRARRLGVGAAAAALVAAAIIAVLARGGGNPTLAPRSASPAASQPAAAGDRSRAAGALAPADPAPSAPAASGQTVSARPAPPDPAPPAPAAERTARRRRPAADVDSSGRGHPTASARKRAPAKPRALGIEEW